MMQPAYNYDDVPRCVSQFTGKERDTETGLDYFGARYYGSTMGRFTSVDPGPFTVADPQSWNRYSYVQNNPLKFIDPNGRTLTLNGTDAADLVDELQRKTGYKLNRNTHTGEVTIDGKTKRQTKGTSKELAKELKKVIGDSHTVAIDVGHNQANTFFDAFVNQKLDMADYKAINNQYPSLAASALVHVFEEYLTAATSGQGFTAQTFPGAHAAGLAEESKVMADYTHASEQPRQEAVSGNTVQFIYTSVQFDVVVKNNQNGPSVGPIKKTQPTVQSVP